MKKCIHIVGMLIFVVLLNNSAILRAEEGSISQEKFTDNFDRFESGEQNPLILGSHSRHSIEDIQYVFITGFLPSRLPDYFEGQMKVLERLGIPKRKLHLLKPPSRLTVTQSANWLKRELEAIPGKLVVVAHSKGGTEALVLALKNSSFVDKRVDDLYLLQPAIGGSPLSDVMLDPSFDWSKFDHFTEQEKKQMFKEWLSGQVPKYFLGQGMKSVRTEIRHKENGEILAANPTAAKIVSSKIHYLTSEIEDPSIYDIRVRTLWRIISELHGKNDGVVPLSMQTMDGIGDVIFHSNAEHGDFTARSITDKTTNQKASLAKAIAVAVETKDKPSHPLCPWIFRSITQ